AGKTLSKAAPCWHGRWRRRSGPDAERLANRDAPMHRLLPLLLLAVPAALAGCATADQLLFKGLAGEAPGEYRPAPPPIAEGALATPPPPIGSTQFKPTPPTPSAATDSETGRKIAALRTE